jgi:4-hydroxy-tetrahydrodipicolinate synthase
MALAPSTFVISITPFDAEGRLDEAAFRAHLSRLGKSGIGVYVGGGGSGEGYTLNRGEAKRVMEIAAEELKGKVPVRAMGVEPRTAEQMVEFLQMAKASGVEAAQVYSLDVGHAHIPTEDELNAYFNEVLDSTDFPCILSTHQSVGYRIPAELVVGVAKRYKHVVGINCTHPDLGYLAAVIDGVAGSIPVHVGGPMQGLTVFAMGGQGYLSSEGNLAPNLCVRVVDCYAKGDMQGMMNAFGKLIRLFTALYGNGGIRATKAVLNHLGMAGGYPRKPRLPIKQDALNRALKVVEQLGIAEIEKW